MCNIWKGLFKDILEGRRISNILNIILAVLLIIATSIAIVEHFKKKKAQKKVEQLTPSSDLESFWKPFIQKHVDIVFPQQLELYVGPERLSDLSILERDEISNHRLRVFPPPTTSQKLLDFYGNRRRPAFTVDEPAYWDVRYAPFYTGINDVKGIGIISDMLSKLYLHYCVSGENTYKFIEDSFFTSMPTGTVEISGLQMEAQDNNLVFIGGGSVTEKLKEYIYNNFKSYYKYSGTSNDEGIVQRITTDNQLSSIKLEGYQFIRGRQDIGFITKFKYKEGTMNRHAWIVIFEGVDGEGTYGSALAFKKEFDRDEGNRFADFNSDAEISAVIKVPLENNSINEAGIALEIMALERR